MAKVTFRITITIESPAEMKIMNKVINALADLLKLGKVEITSK